MQRSTYVAPSSSGLGRRPLKAEVAGSNPVGATKKLAGQECFTPGFFYLSQILLQFAPQSLDRIRGLYSSDYMTQCHIYYKTSVSVQSSLG